MSTAFLSADASQSPAALSPFNVELIVDGAELRVLDGWQVAMSFGDRPAEEAACAETVGWTDLSYLGKLELQGNPATIARLRRAAGVKKPRPGSVARSASSVWIDLTPERALALCEPADLPGLREQTSAGSVDVTSSFAAVSVMGPLARDTFARFCALDLRESELPIDGFRPGSVARVPGLLLREGPQRFTVMFGAAYASYFWEVVTDAGTRLGGRPVGATAFKSAISKESRTDA